MADLGQEAAQVPPGRGALGLGDEAPHQWQQLLGLLGPQVQVKHPGIGLAHPWVPECCQSTDGW